MNKQNVNVPSPSQQRLIKFVAHAGICSRRKAEYLIKEGFITVNGESVTDPSIFLEPTDEVRYQDQRLKQEEFFYLAVNKPKNVVCTAYDPDGKTTIFDTIKDRRLPKVRFYHIGRLDQTSTGLLLMTNDGDFCQSIAHPSCAISKSYKVTLHKDLTEEAIETIKRGVKLYDGFVKVDTITQARSRVAHTFIVTLHSGKNRIIRRIFECIGYFVTHLERISLGPISLKGLAVGQWRFLSSSEIANLRTAAASNLVTNKNKLVTEKKQPRSKSRIKKSRNH